MILRHHHQKKSSPTLRVAIGHVPSFCRRPPDPGKLEGSLPAREPARATYNYLIEKNRPLKTIGQNKKQNNLTGRPSHSRPKVYICCQRFSRSCRCAHGNYLTASSTENNFRALPVVFFLAVGGSFLTALRR